ncbi:hypothetical protein D3C71_818790 [compost metagenome]
MAGLFAFDMSDIVRRIHIYAGITVFLAQCTPIRNDICRVGEMIDTAVIEVK